MFQSCEEVCCMYRSKNRFLFSLTIQYMCYGKEEITRLKIGTAKLLKAVINLKQKSIFMVFRLKQIAEGF